MLMQALRALVEPQPVPPPPVVEQRSGGVKIYSLEVPYILSTQTWAEQVMALAPKTGQGAPVLECNNCFEVPAPPASGRFTALLVKSSYFAHGDALVTMPDEGYHEASPYHLFALHRHVGNLQKWVSWQGKRGPGILAPQPGKNVPDLDHSGFSVWYPNIGSECWAGLTPLDEYLGSLTLYAFVKESWQPM